MSGFLTSRDYKGMNPFMKILNRKKGRDTSGQMHCIGDTDSDGYRVGYIDSKGNSWESRDEFELATASGRLHDAFVTRDPEDLYKALVFLKREVDEKNLAEIATKTWYEDFVRDLVNTVRQNRGEK